MEYLKEYNITEEQIQSLKNRYNNGIVKFIEQNEDYIEEKLDYLQEEKFVFLYEIIYNNVKVFLDEIYFLKEKVEIMRRQNISQKAMNMVLINEDLYDKIV